MKVWTSLAAAGLLLACASSPPSRLHTLGKPSGSGEIHFAVENRTAAVVNNLYLAPSERVKAAGEAAFQGDAAAQATLWGEDRLPGSGLEPKGQVTVTVPGPGTYDVRALDRDRREQHVSGLRLRAGGRYVLELEEGGWRAPR